MKITELFEQYANKMSQILLYHRAVKQNAQKELNQLNEHAASLEKQPELKEFLSMNKMIFRSAKDGEHHIYGKRKSNAEDRKKEIVLHKNKQYQWLLAEAYEEFEDYIEGVYGFSAFIDNNLWPLKDFGNISFAELKEQNFEWFVSQAQAKRDAPQSILSQFRKIFPDISKIEVSNELNVNLKLAIILIENLRHIIVHKSGIVSDKDQFIEKTLKKAGLHNNGKPQQDYLDFITSFFGRGDYENHIVLLEVRVEPEIPLDIHVNLFELLSGYLMSYAYMIFEFINERGNGEQ